MAHAITTDDELWHGAYQAHGPVVLAFLRRRLGREEAEDVLQETFVRAIRAGTLGDAANPRAYLMATARHVLINRLRRPRLVVAAADETLDAAPSPEVSPEGDAAWSAFRRRLAEAMDALGESHRQAFEMAVIDGRPYAEVARLTGWSLAQVKVNVHRARQRLTTALADYLPATEP